MQRRRFKNILSFPDRLDQEIERLRAEAEKLPLGSHEREMLLRKARQAETAMRVNDWLNSPGLRPPEAVEDFAARRSGQGGAGRPSMSIDKQPSGPMHPARSTSRGTRCAPSG